MINWDRIQVFCHSSIKLMGSKIIYIDPFRIPESFQDADIIFLTHSHEDHLSPSDIRKVAKRETTFVLPKKEVDILYSLSIPKEKVIGVEPKGEYKIGEIMIKTIPAYNQTKKFHSKENGWVGYEITMDHTIYYIAGDTDKIEEMKQIHCDIAFLPIGGTYTMDLQEAASCARCMDAKAIVPTHYGSIVGSATDGKKFEKLVQKQVKLLIKEE